VADATKVFLGQDRRNYEVLLMCDQQRGHFVKITELGRQYRNSLLLAVADVPSFLEELDGLFTGESEVGSILIALLLPRRTSS